MMRVWLLILLSAPPAMAQSVSTGVRAFEDPRGRFAVKTLVDATNLPSGEFEIAEVDFAPGTKIPPHRHGSFEAIYVISGTLLHGTESATPAVLGTGTVALVDPGELVTHEVVGDEPVKLLVVWVPGGEADRVAPLEPIPNEESGHP